MLALVSILNIDIAYAGVVQHQIQYDCQLIAIIFSLKRYCGQKIYKGKIGKLQISPKGLQFIQKF